MLRMLLKDRNGQDTQRKLVFGLSNENLRRLKAGLPITTAMEELVPEWVGDVWLFAQGNLHHEIAAAQHTRTGRTQLVLTLGPDAFAKLEAFPRKAITLSFKEPWQGMIYLVRGETEKDLLEEWAPLLGPGSEMRLDPRTL